MNTSTRLHHALIRAWLTALLAAGSAVAAMPSADAPPAGTEDPRQFIEFIREDNADCQIREGQHLAVRSTHPTRTIRVWLDRYYQNVGTGDRSHSDLRPNAEPEALGCDTVMHGKQEWRVQRAQYVD